jgi:threonine dehydrogenase-like Zn-dependent dehydrogenase
LVWDKLAEIEPSRYITQRIPFDQAERAYHLLAQKPEEALQVVLVYDEE